AGHGAPPAPGAVGEVGGAPPPPPPRRGLPDPSSQEEKGEVSRLRGGPGYPSHRLGHFHPRGRTSPGWRARARTVFGESSETTWTGSRPLTGLVATSPVRRARSMAVHSALARSSWPTAKKWRSGSGSPATSSITPIIHAIGVR